MKPFIKMIKSKEAFELMKKPNAFILLTQIAYRAKRTNDFSIHGLEIGEALIGDYKSIGLTEKKYRTAKAQLQSWGFAAFKGTSKGTVAKLINSRIFDINEECGGRTRGRSKGDQRATNKNDKKEKNNIYSQNGVPYQAIVDSFNQILPELPTVQMVTDKRKKCLRARWFTSDNTASLDWWNDFFNLIRGSPFLMGQKTDGFRASFDWIINKSNFVKIIEGNYHK